MDDKAKIPIGEPGTPEAATFHNRRALSKSGIILEASDHNYHSVNITPLVILSCEIPNSPQESFYSGQMYVSLKDSVFHGSDSLRHIVELCAVLESNTSEKPFYLYSAMEEVITTLHFYLYKVVYSHCF